MRAGSLIFVLRCIVTSIRDVTFVSGCSLKQIRSKCSLVGMKLFNASCRSLHLRGNWKEKIIFYLKCRYRVSIETWLPEIFSIIIIFPLNLFSYTFSLRNALFPFTRFFAITHGLVWGLQDPCKIPGFSKKTLKLLIFRNFKQCFFIMFITPFCRAPWALSK
jgi:hypothetical protein